MKKYTRRRGLKCSNYLKKSTRHKHLTRSKHSRRLTGGVSIRSRQSLAQSKAPSRAPTSSKAPSRAPSKGVVVIRNRKHIYQHTPSSSLRIAGISKQTIDTTDADAIYAANLVSKFPLGMDKFLQIVIKNYEILNYEKVKLALRDKISINKDPAIGRLSINGIIFISYISGRLICLLKELSMTTTEEHDKKKEILDNIKHIEKIICLLDGVGCSWGIRPYNLYEMNIIAEYYKTVKNTGSSFEEYNRLLTEFINKYFPVLTKYTDPSHVISTSICRRIIPGKVLEMIPEDEPMNVS